MINSGRDVEDVLVPRLVSPGFPHHRRQSTALQSRAAGHFRRGRRSDGPVAAIPGGPRRLDCLLQFLAGSGVRAVEGDRGGRSDRLVVRRQRAGHRRSGTRLSKMRGARGTSSSSMTARTRIGRPTRSSRAWPRLIRACRSSRLREALRAIGSSRKRTNSRSITPRSSRGSGRRPMPRRLPRED